MAKSKAARAVKKQAVKAQAPVAPVVPEAPAPVVAQTGPAVEQINQDSTVVHTAAAEQETQAADTTAATTANIEQAEEPAEKAASDDAAPPKDPANVAVRYIGPKDEHEDVVGGLWHPGQIRLVTRSLAALLLFHVQCWEDARPKDAIRKDPIEPKAPANLRYLDDDVEGKEYPPMLHLSNLGKVELLQYGQRYLGQKFDESLSESALREQIQRISIAKTRFEYA